MADTNDDISTDDVDVAMVYAAMKMASRFNYQTWHEHADAYVVIYEAIRKAYTGKEGLRKLLPGSARAKPKQRQQ
jgi:hypothetical protein